MVLRHLYGIINIFIKVSSVAFLEDVTVVVSVLVAVMSGIRTVHRATPTLCLCRAKEGHQHHENEKKEAEDPHAAVDVDLLKLNLFELK